MILPVSAGSTIYDMAKQVFGPGMAETLSEWMDKVLGAMKDVLALGYVDDIINVFSIVGCSFMVIYFFADMMNQASKDMFSFEKLVIAFIRMLTAFAILLFLPDILDYLPDWAMGFKEVIFMDGDTMDGSLDMSKIWGAADGLDKYKGYYNHFTKAFEVIGALFGLFIPYLISIFAELMGKFIITSTAVMLVVRTLFAPLGVVQIFEEGTRSSGIRYLKGLLAEGLSFACIIGIILIANSITGALVSDSVDVVKSLNVNPEKLGDALQFNTLISIIIPKLVVAGGMASGSKIAHDVMGA